MLHHLHIQNFALIEDLFIDFSEGFSVITGETGAGKSILLGALGFVLGDRADTGVLLDKNRKCIVEAVFSFDNDRLKTAFETNDLDFDPNECIFRRELNPQKKSRAFINDTPVTLQTLKAIGCQLVDIHSQHDSLLLTDTDFQLQLLDEIAQNNMLLSAYRKEFAQYNTLCRQLKDLKTMAEKNLSENDYLKFQLDELQKAQLKEGEYVEIENSLNVMENAEEIKSLLFSANGLLGNSESAILPQLNELSSLLQRIKQLIPNAEGLKERIDNAQIELKDIAYDLERLEDGTQFDEEKLQELQERFDLLNRLMMKHHINEFDAMIQLRDELESKVNAFENIDQEIEKAEKALKEQTQLLKQLALQLRSQRQKASKTFSENVTGLARQLAMPHAAFQISLEPLQDLTSTGLDQVRFLFSANKGVEVADISKVASGGELSRVMLSVKSAVSQHNYIPTLIFDEIDAGVSGEVAAKIGDIMQEMGSSLQLIAITHLPQVASKAAHHFFIYKDNEGERTQSHIKLLSAKERITEIAKMLSNDKITPEAMKAAEVLLNSQTRT
ncbi:MAG: DNA repair protein RecN [Bacteroidales bacterium]|nr:DNA repair protein RecN [Bacteroidales bacterium]